MIWIFYVLAAATLISVAAVLAKLGTKKADSAVAAGLFITLILIGNFLLLGKKLSISQVTGFGKSTWISIFLGGLAIGVAVLFFFKSVNEDRITHVVPIIQLRTIFVILFGVVYWHNKLGVNSIIAIVCCFVGIVVIIFGDTKNLKWLAYALISTVFFVVEDILGSIWGHGVSSGVLLFYKLIIAAILIWAVSIASGSGKKLRAISFLDGIYICISGAFVVISQVCLSRSQSLSGNVNALWIYRTNLFITLLLAAMLLKEKISGRKLIGVLVFIAGLLVLLLEKPLF